METDSGDISVVISVLTNLSMVNDHPWQDLLSHTNHLTLTSFSTAVIAFLQHFSIACVKKTAEHPGHWAYVLLNVGEPPKAAYQCCKIQMDLTEIEVMVISSCSH